MKNFSTSSGYKKLSKLLGQWINVFHIRSIKWGCSSICAFFSSSFRGVSIMSRIQRRLHPSPLKWSRKKGLNLFRLNLFQCGFYPQKPWERWFWPTKDMGKAKGKEHKKSESSWDPKFLYKTHISLISRGALFIFRRTHFLFHLPDQLECLPSRFQQLFVLPRPLGLLLGGH